MTSGTVRYLQRNGIALLALFVALGGTGYAATGFPANVIGAKQLKRNAVTTPKIKNRAITGAKVAKDAITGTHIRESSLGKVRSAAHADTATSATTATAAANATNATNAVNATNATNATKATKAEGADYATDAEKLDGLAASAYQRRVIGSCPDGTGISAIAPSGSVACTTPVKPISKVVPNDSVDDTLSPLPNLAIGINCNHGATLVAFGNGSGSAATLNWIYSNAAGTISATGAVLGTSPPSNEQDFLFDEDRIEGQFVFADATSVTTINLHVSDANAGGCEIRGTAERVVTG
jgi:hypothetical protein